MRKLVALSVGFVLCSCPVFADGIAASDIYKASAPSVMVLEAKLKDGSGALGTGFVAVKDGFAITAWHVVRNATSITAKFSDGQQFDVSGLVDSDPSRDVALIRVKEFGRKPLTLATGQPGVGDKAFVIGTPIGLDFSISDGIVSQIRQLNGVNLYQYTCPTTHGSSGGPLFNDKGEVIGIVHTGLDASLGQNLFFAIPSTYALGLDATLPTKPWDQVKDAPVGPEETTAPVALVTTDVDTKIANAMAVTYDVIPTVNLRAHLCHIQDASYRDGAGIEIFQLQDRLKSTKEDLKNLSSNGPLRQRVIDTLIADIDKDQDAISNFITGITEAQQADHWTGISKDFIQKAIAQLDDVKWVNSEDMAELVKSDVFVKAQPFMVKEYLATSDPHVYDLDLGSNLEDSLRCCYVINNGHGFRLGLKASDIIRSINDEPVADLVDFRTKIAANVGRKVRITVLRDGKVKSWDASVPN